MKPKILFERIIPLAFVIEVIGFLVFIFYPAPQNFVKFDQVSAAVEANNVVKVSEPEKLVGPGLPVRLKIPDINIDSAIEYVGVTQDGAMGSPESYNSVAWFELGKRPGEPGSAVIAGHYGFKDKKASVFDNLHKLRKGDRLYIKDDKGIFISFIVSDIRRYDADVVAPEIFESNDEKAHLNLITCEGDWNEETESYPSRLVIFTDKE